MNKDTLAKKIFITGSGGLVGRNIVESLADSNYQLLTPSSSDLDLRNFSAVQSWIKENKPDLVIHCAGIVGGIQANMREPVRFLVDNLDMGRNIVLAAREAGVKQLINMGSSCMYPRNAPNPLQESLVLAGELEPTNEGYALAKITTQRLCSYINREDPQFQYKTLIPCNLFGRYDKFDLAHAHMVPSAICKIYHAMQEGGDVTIWGTGLVRREFMYAGDLAQFVKYAITHFSEMPEILNVGTGKDYTINEYYEVAAKVIGFTGSFVHDTNKPEGMKQKLVDVSLLDSYGWKSETSLEEGIKQTYNYFLSTMEKHK